MLASNLFFTSDTVWTGGNAAPPSNTPPPDRQQDPANAGGGHSRDYQSLADDFWDERELHMQPRSEAPAAKPAPAPIPVAVVAPEQPNADAARRMALLGQLVQVRQTLLATAGQSRDVGELRARAAKLKQLDEAIDALKKVVRPS